MAWLLGVLVAFNPFDYDIGRDGTDGLCCRRYYVPVRSQCLCGVIVFPLLLLLKSLGYAFVVDVVGTCGFDLCIRVF